MKQLLAAVLTLTLILGSIGGVYAQDQSTVALEEKSLTETLENELAGLEELQESKVSSESELEDVSTGNENDTEQLAIEESGHQEEFEAEAAEEQHTDVVSGEAAAVTTYEELVAAIEAAEDGGTVEIANDIDLPETIELSKSLTLQGLGSEEVVLTTSSGYRHFLITGGEIRFTTRNVALDGELVLDENGGAVSGAGGIRSDAEHLIVDAVIRNCLGTDFYFDNNEYALAGGGIYASVALTVIGGEISGNYVGFLGGHGGGMYGGRESTITVSGGQISGNSAQIGGGVYGDNRSTITISGGQISKNITVSSGGGVGVEDNSVITITDGEISENSSANGGGVSAGNDSNIIITGGEISGNSADYWGGGVLGTAIIINGGEISGNSAGSGGAVFGSANIAVEGGKISGNSAATTGGGVYGLSSFITITGGEISGNFAGDIGGGVLGVGGSVIAITNGLISGNIADGNGGGIWKDIYTSLTITGGEISGNSAANGGGIWADDYYGTFDLTQVKIRDQAIVKDNLSSQAYYMTDPDDIALHNQNIDPTVTWTNGFDYIYNNHDVGYNKGETEPPVNTHTVTIICHYLDGAYPDDVQQFQVEPGAYFEEHYQARENYRLVEQQLMSRFLWGVDPEDQLVYISSVNEDITVQLNFERSAYAVTIVCHYLDGAYPDDVQQFQVEPGAYFEEHYQVRENYRLVEQQLMSRFLWGVDPEDQLVYISSVDEDITIQLNFEKNAYTVTVITQYGDGVTSDSEELYRVEEGEAFVGYFEIPDGYRYRRFMASPEVAINIPEQKITVDSVVRDIQVYIILAPNT